MATIKSYTDLEQSKKLAEILPVESADMYYHPYPNDEDWYDIPNFGEADLKFNQLPCWSLTGLLNQIPSDIKTNDRCHYTLEIEKCDAEHLPYGLNYHDTWCSGEDIITHYYDNLIDACYEMILKLHELKLL